GTSLPDRASVVEMSPRMTDSRFFSSRLPARLASSNFCRTFSFKLMAPLLPSLKNSCICGPLPQERRVSLRLCRLHLRNEVIGERLEAPGVTARDGFPVALHIGLAEVVAHVLLPFFPVLR